jgi:hypothetical protein
MKRPPIFSAAAFLDVTDKSWRRSSTVPGRSLTRFCNRSSRAILETVRTGASYRRGERILRV